ncbi:MAG: flagellar basal body protein, partial [Desulfobulbaceae bacterium]|nr:flagellar basal body protein [Desulfobulbaceae bacterium]
MDILTAMQISGSALKAERTRLNITAMNLANANTTRTMEGGPYRAKSVIFAAKPLPRSFGDTLQS